MSPCPGSATQAHVTCPKPSATVSHDPPPSSEAKTRPSSVPKMPRRCPRRGSDCRRCPGTTRVGRTHSARRLPRRAGAHVDGRAAASRTGGGAQEEHIAVERDRARVRSVEAFVEKRHDSPPSTDPRARERLPRRRGRRRWDRSPPDAHRRRCRSSASTRHPGRPSEGSRRRARSRTQHHPGRRRATSCRAGLPTACTSRHALLLRRTRAASRLDPPRIDANRAFDVPTKAPSPNGSRHRPVSPSTDATDSTPVPRSRSTSAPSASTHHPSVAAASAVISRPSSRRLPLASISPFRVPTTQSTRLG